MDASLTLIFVGAFPFIWASMSCASGIKLNRRPSHVTSQDPEGDSAHLEIDYTEVEKGKVDFGSDTHTETVVAEVTITKVVNLCSTEKRVAFGKPTKAACRRNPSRTRAQRNELGLVRVCCRLASCWLRGRGPPTLDRSSRSSSRWIRCSSSRRSGCIQHGERTYEHSGRFVNCQS